MLKVSVDVAPSSYSGPDPRIEVVAAGFGLLCTTEEECLGEARVAEDGTILVAYTWHASACVRVERLRRGLAAAMSLRDAGQA